MISGNISGTKTPIKPFPKLMKGRASNDSSIYLMLSSCTGMRIHSQSGQKVGDFSDDWCSDGLEDFNGVLTLENE